MRSVSETLDLALPSRPTPRPQGSILRNILYVAGGVLVTASLLPLVRGDAWWIRVFDYPRLQIATVLASLTGVYVWKCYRGRWYDLLFIALSVGATSLQLHQIFPHTHLAPVQVKSAVQTSPANDFSLVISNVLQPNREVERLIALVDEKDPDILLALETNMWWEDKLRALEDRYPYILRRPMENTYGMLLYSKLPLDDTEIAFLADPDVPSMHATVTLPSGQKFRLHCLHPKPPHPVYDISTAERDAELIMVARSVAGDSRPHVVAGDLNDVAWSHTTRLFQRISRLLDPRIGRGLFSTFPANLPLLRFPIDHVFHSTNFKLVEIERLPNMGSDHFPMYVKLQFEPDAVRQQAPPEQPDTADREEAREIINKVDQIDDTTKISR